MHPYRSHRPQKYVMQDGALYRWSPVFNKYVMVEPTKYLGMGVKAAVRAHNQEIARRNGNTTGYEQVQR